MDTDYACALRIPHIQYGILRELNTVENKQTMSLVNKSFYRAYYSYKSWMNMRGISVHAYNNVGTLGINHFKLYYYLYKNKFI